MYQKLDKGGLGRPTRYIVFAYYNTQSTKAGEVYSKQIEASLASAKAQENKFTKAGFVTKVIKVTL